MPSVLKRPTWNILVDWMENGRLRRGVVTGAGFDLTGKMRVRCVDVETNGNVYVDSQLARPIGAWTDDQGDGVAEKTERLLNNLHDALLIRATPKVGLEHLHP